MSTNNGKKKKKMFQNLTEKDRKVLKYEKRAGYVLSGLILCFGGLFNLVYLVMPSNEPNFLIIGIIDTAILLLSYFTCYKINYKINLDLKENEKKLVKRTVDKKVEEKSHETGSGNLYIPILGELFPMLWGQKMNEKKKYFIYSNDYKHEVDEETYNYLKNGNEFYIHLAKNSGVILSFSRVE